MRKEKTQSAFIYLLLFIIVLMIHIPMTYVSDDAEVIAGIQNQTVWENFVYHFYSNGRIFTDVLANMIYRMPFLLWKIFDSLVYVAIAGLLSYLFTGKKAADIVAVCTLMLLFPFQYLASAGYVATTTNYIYPVLCLLLAVVPFKKLSEGQPVSRGNHAAAILAMAYISNHDQSAMVLIGGLVLLLLSSFVLAHDKKLIRLAWIYLAVSVLFYGVMFLLPGHFNRMNDSTETLYWFPEYFQWTFLKKVYHGYASTMANLLYNDVLLFEVFCALIFVCALVDGKVSNMMIAAIPIAVMVACKELGRENFIVIRPYTYRMPEFYPFGRSFSGFVPVALSLVAVLAIVVSLFRIVKNGKRKWGLIGLLILAAGSREMMGFSGTIYASSFRTFTAFLYLLVIACLVLLNEIRDQAGSK